LDEAERRNVVRSIAREGDPDRAISVLFAPSEARNSLFALYAFNVELARVAEQVKEADLGFIRLRWWHEALERAAKGWLTGHPVADAFGAAMRRRKLSARHVASLIDARNFDIAEKIMLDWPSLEAYLQHTAGALFYLAGQILGGEDGKLERAAKPAAVAYGLTGLMRAMPINAAQGRVYLPADMLGRYGASSDQILAGKASVALAQALAEMRDKARTSLKEAKADLRALKFRERTAFLPLCLVRPYLSALEKAASDPFKRVARINPLYRLLRLSLRIK
jgi:15-cis-phytoene synthase